MEQARAQRTVPQQQYLLEYIKTLNMADIGETVPSSRPMHLDMPNSQNEGIVTSDLDGSSPEEPQGATDLAEERAQSIVGVSISRAQTRLVSPKTPAVEKAAAVAEVEGGGWFDGAAEDEEDTPAETQDLKDAQSTPTTRTLDTSLPSTPPRVNEKAGLPSPWRASPKTFERQRTGGQYQPITGPTTMLSDLNVRRYMASFNLPSLPKASSFKDLTMPSLSSILSNTRSRSPLRKNGTRQNRANTLDEPPSSWALGSPFATRPTFETRTRKDNGKGQRDLSMVKKTHDDKVAESTRQYVPMRCDPPISHRPRAASSGSIKTSQHPRLRRATSDQSLLLRHVTSTGSSLGDDSRWENVQEQVNSRMKAIKDSWQDSSIKLPSMPNLSSLNLGTFRPEFTRSRADSASRKPRLSNAYPYVDHFDQPGSRGASTMSRLDKPRLPDSEAFNVNKKGSKATDSYLDMALENLTGDLVIMGGYRGSILRSSQPPHRQLWVPVKVGLNIRKVNLEVGLEPEDEENMHDHIFASGMLSHIGPIDMGRRLLKRLHACNNVQHGKLRIHDHGWDWRLSPHLMSRRLIAFLAELQCNRPDVPMHERGAIVIAHSMGGLITRHAVNQRPELFAGVVYAGVPQHCVNILGPLRNGDEVLLSSKVLTAQVNFTLRSSFLLLPEDGKCFINKDTREAYPVDFFNVEQWKEYAWSPCIAPALPPINPAENKTLLSSMTEMLPSMPSLPLPGRKASTSIPRSNDTNLSSTADTTTTKLNDLTNPSALDPSFTPSTTTTLTSRPQSTIPLPRALAYLKHTLAATLAFKAEMTHDPTFSPQHENLYPPLAILYANNTPTVFAARVANREGIKRTDAYDDLQFASGDGVCLAKAAMLPAGYEVSKGGKVRTERGHVGLLGDLEGVGRCLIAVMRGRRESVGLGLKVKEMMG